uniref:Trichome birefringence-like N-terminal domain-containing protein n=1 Tax=Chenopodium quinoa TaxID=63459 RepID=A0A803KX43_CHEQI
MNIFSSGSSISRSTSTNRKNATAIGSPKVFLHKDKSDNSNGLRRDSLIPRNLCFLFITGPLITFYLCLSFGYFNIFPDLGLVFHKYGASSSNCDVFDGSWVSDYNYPLYNSSECPFVEQGFNCLGNGRKNKKYLRWRWKPKDCDIPAFNASNILERLRGKRVVFVGDSMSRTQWESFICLLMTGVEDKKSVYEVKGRNITKTTRHLAVRFRSFNLSVEFYRSVFLVQPGIATKHSPKRVKSTLKLDKMDAISKEWVNSDAIIFNSGHWWIPSKLYETGCYFQLGGSLKLGMSIPSAFKTAMATWASWVEASVDSKRTRVYFRTFEPSHWSIQSSAHCTVMQFPESDYDFKHQSPFSDVVIDIVKKMRFPVKMLRITSMSASRGDAHVGNWSDRKSFADCSHWCLPGVPDFWNEILLSDLFSDKVLPKND